MTGPLMAAAGVVLLGLQLHWHQDVKPIAIVKVRQIEVVALKVPVKGCFR